MLNVPFNNGGCFNLSFYSLCVFYSYKNKRRAILNFSLSPIEAHAHRSIVFCRGTTLSLVSVFSSSRNRSVETSSIRLPFSTFVRPPVRHTDIILHHFTSSRRISFHFYVIRDVFSIILRHSFHCVAPIVNFNLIQTNQIFSLFSFFRSG